MLGDKMQQHVAVTLHSNKCFVCTGELFVKIFVSTIWFYATCWGDKILLLRQIFPKILQYYLKQFVAASVAQFVLLPVHKKLLFAVTCCSNMCPSVFQSLGGLEIRKKLLNHYLFHLFF